MSGYVFITNSNKPNFKEFNSRSEIRITSVSNPYLKKAINMGYNVFLGVNRAKPEELKCELPVGLYDSHTYRSIFAIKDNYIAFKNLANLVKKNEIEVIHCNTPVGGLIGRIVGRLYNIKKVIYTAHGFHFFKGAPFLYNTVIKLAERIMARWTDAIITMNEEDYKAAQKFKLKNNGKVFKIHGVGIDLSLYKKLFDRKKIREILKIKDDEIAIISVGDINLNKNNIAVIEALNKLKNNKIHYFICGEGNQKNNLYNKTKDFKLEKQIHFLGYRNDIKDLLYASDIFINSSKREGLPRSVMEAMAVGLPCVVSNIRGNIDLIDNEKGGFLCDVNDSQSFANAINKLSINPQLRFDMGNYNKEHIKEFDISVVEKEIENIYASTIEKINKVAER